MTRSAEPVSGGASGRLEGMTDPGRRAGGSTTGPFAAGQARGSGSATGFEPSGCHLGPSIGPPGAPLDADTHLMLMISR